MGVYKMITIKDRIEQISNNAVSTDEDSNFIMFVLHRLGFNNALVTCGVVYIEGHGTIENPPTSIQNIASMILKLLNIEESC